jgi:hypothetical protein
LQGGKDSLKREAFRVARETLDVSDIGDATASLGPLCLDDVIDGICNLRSDVIA